MGRDRRDAEQGVRHAPLRKGDAAALAGHGGRGIVNVCVASWRHAWLAAISSSRCIRRLGAALRTPQERLGVSHPSETSWPWSQAAPTRRHLLRVCDLWHLTNAGGDAQGEHQAAPRGARRPAARAAGHAAEAAAARPQPPQQAARQPPQERRRQRRDGAARAGVGAVGDCAAVGAGGHGHGLRRLRRRCVSRPPSPPPSAHSMWVLMPLIPACMWVLMPPPPLLHDEQPTR